MFGPVLYLIYTADLATNEEVITLPFIDHTAILTENPDPTVTVTTFQENLDQIEK